MHLNKIKIGGLTAENNVFLAPLAGYTNAPFRDMCRSMGASVTFTEMVSAAGLYRGNEKTEKLLYVSPDYNGIRACQIFGNDAEIMRSVCESESLEKFDLIDINMGCPVPKIYKNGEGCALMADMPRAEKIISECKKSGKYISVKFRTGISENNVNCVEFAKMCAGAGADMITVHGRTRDKMYAGEVNFKAIAQAKNAVNIPVIANGGIFSVADAEKLLNETGADGIAVARGAMYSPRLIGELCGKPVKDIKALIFKQFDDTLSLYGERFTCVHMRKMAAFYLRGKTNAIHDKERLFKASSCAEVKEIIEELQF